MANYKENTILNISWTYIADLKLGNGMYLTVTPILTGTLKKFVQEIPIRNKNCQWLRMKFSC